MMGIGFITLKVTERFKLTADLLTFFFRGMSCQCDACTDAMKEIAYERIARCGERNSRSFDFLFFLGHVLPMGRLHRSHEGNCLRKYCSVREIIRGAHIEGLTTSPAMKAMIAMTQSAYDNKVLGVEKCSDVSH